MESFIDINITALLKGNLNTVYFKAKNENNQQAILNLLNDILHTC